MLGRIREEGSRQAWFSTVLFYLVTQWSLLKMSQFYKPLGFRCMWNFSSRSFITGLLSPQTGRLLEIFNENFRYSSSNFQEKESLWYHAVFDLPLCWLFIPVRAYAPLISSWACDSILFLDSLRSDEWPAGRHFSQMIRVHANEMNQVFDPCIPVGLSVWEWFGFVVPLLLASLT